MIEGIMRLDFTSFREVNFKSAALTFSDNSVLKVAQAKRQRDRKSHTCLRVTFKKQNMDLATVKGGPYFPDESDMIKTFQKRFFEFASGLEVQRISTSRLQNLYQEHERRRLAEELKSSELPHESETAYRRFRQQGERNVLLAEKVQAFIRDAQLNSRRFFAGRDPSLFARILENLTESEQKTALTPAAISERITVLYEQDEQAKRYQLFGERWDHRQLKSVLGKTGKGTPNSHALTVINTYVELLESRAGERKLLVNRLETFESTLNEFLSHKTVSVNAKDGLIIETSDGTMLAEKNLSSGEYHLLYLFVIALTTQRRGMVIAIDEPEISMHLSWQRKLIPALLKCASSAQPQFIIATHSPDITASHPDNCEYLGTIEE
jgi:predicted ATP-dependent endonuclease of OLD family